MLFLTRKKGGRIIIELKDGTEIIILVGRIYGIEGEVKRVGVTIGIEAPRDVSIRREELASRKTSSKEGGK